MLTKIKFKRNIAATLLLILCICAFFLMASLRINRLATDACFASLDDTAGQVALEIRAIVKANQEQLDMAADLLAQHDSDEMAIVQRHLSAYRQRGTMSCIALLMPDGQMLTGAGEALSPAGLEFQTERDKAPYVSGVVSLPEDPDAKLFYQVAPVQRGGETVALLYGFVDLQAFADQLTVTAFDGKAQIYVADGETGDFLVDTWHETLGNIFDADIMNRKVKPGYDYLQMKQDFVDGTAGHIAFFSNTAGEYFYSYYMPVGVSRWMLQLTVPESVAFANAILIRKILYFVSILEILLFSVYILWVLSNVHHTTREKEIQLARTRYMYAVQQSLFDAYKQPALLSDALQQVAQMTGARWAFFAALNGREVTAFYASEQQVTPQSLFGQGNVPFGRVFGQLASGTSLILTGAQLREHASEQELQWLDRAGVRSLMLAPVLNSDGALSGILGCAGLEKTPENCALLECVSRSFLMAQSNVTFYRQIEQMGLMDAPTGLRNRNCYEAAVEACPQTPEEGLGFLYLDANGLHELNNTHGHAAGDAMLLCVADTLKTLFRQENCYRIGGDEFAVFCRGLDRVEVARKVEQFNSRMEEFGYHVSIGQAWLEECRDCRDMISVAEMRMYEAKRLFYRQSGGGQRARRPYPELSCN